ncbi:MAG: hypothetical protein PHT49_10850 [Desulfovibrionales bacterium]|nr:hypothetical protein [Desulfovibrionales bacterium]
MKLHFEGNQEYQIEAIRAVTDISGERDGTFLKIITFRTMGISCLP